MHPLSPFVWLRKAVLRSPPLAVLSTVVLLTARWTFFKEIGQTALLVCFGSLFNLKGGQDAPCKLCDLIVQFALKEAKVDKIRGGLKCDKMCWGLGKKCLSTCRTVIDTMKNTTEFPCAAAGICPRVDEFGEHSCRWSFTKLACEPSSQCIRRRGQCELRPGLRQWKRTIRSLRSELALLDDAFHGRARYCSDPEAGPHCITEAHSLSGVISLYLGNGLVLVGGTGLTVRAIESPGGADKRQWLVFWLISFATHFGERFVDVKLSFLPLYYELKLLFVAWIMFGGADRIYREARRRLAAARRALRGAERVRAEDQARYERMLPSVVREAVRSAELHTVLAFASDQQVAASFGHEALGQLRTLWQQAAPRYVQLRLLYASELPAALLHHGEDVQGRGGQGYALSRSGFVLPSVTLGSRAAALRGASWGSSRSLDWLPTWGPGRASRVSYAEASDATLPGESINIDEALGSHPFCVAYLVPPPPTDALGTTLGPCRPSHRWWSMPMRAAVGGAGSHERWKRLRLFVHCLRVAYAWRRRCSSCEGARAALRRGRPLLAACRLGRRLDQLMRHAMHVLRSNGGGEVTDSILAKAFDNGPLGVAREPSTAFHWPSTDLPRPSAPFRALPQARSAVMANTSASFPRCALTRRNPSGMSATSCSYAGARLASTASSATTRHSTRAFGLRCGIATRARATFSLARSRSRSRR